MDKSLLGPKSPLTTVPWTFVPLEHGLLGQLSLGQMWQHPNFFRPKIIVPKLYLKLEFDTEDQVLFMYEKKTLMYHLATVRYIELL